MAERLTAVSIEALRERLTTTLADWGGEVSAVLRELEVRRSKLAELEASRSDPGELEELKRQIGAQSTLIESLTEDAGAAERLRQDAEAKGIEIERLKAELSSKQELIRALRRDAESLDRMKDEGKNKDRELAELRGERDRLRSELEGLGAELGRLREVEAASVPRSELDAMQADLDARKTLIKSLRADAERATSFESLLEEKREVIRELETSINRHAETIDELKRSADLWKQKYLRLQGNDTVTSVPVPALSATDVRSFEEVAGESSHDRTMAIDMREALLKARRAAAGSGPKAKN